MASKKTVKKTTRTKAKKAVGKKVVTKKRVVKNTATTKTAKKAVKKAAKKSATTRTPKRLSDRVLVCAPSEHCFWTNDGSILTDLIDLEAALKTMGLDVYGHHVTTDKNDFADWVEFVLSDPDCAAAVRKARKPHTARAVIAKHLKLYKK